MTAAEIPAFREALMAWYRLHRRDLPWRRTTDPYAIWVSEIMLQQTRVAAVIDHYQRFMERFPTVMSLALAEEQAVLALWSGLGYYRRARLMHRAAQQVVHEHKGSIPRSLNQLRGMAGVGVYTSAAIASIAHGVPVAAVDGNVERVLARLAGEEAQRGAVKWQALAQKLLHPDHPGDHNQAVMELGATVCTPRAPRCLECPVYTWCRTRGEHPVAARPKMRSVEVAYGLFLIGSGEKAKILLHQRAAESAIMPGLWELPQLARDPKGVEPALTVRHSITTTNYYVRIFRLPQPGAAISTQEKWVRLDELPQLPLTGLARKVLRRLGHLSAPQSGGEVKTAKAKR
jgi:A/G-specific adenine glycosylase